MVVKKTGNKNRHFFFMKEKKKKVVLFTSNRLKKKFPYNPERKTFFSLPFFILSPSRVAKGNDDDNNDEKADEGERSKMETAMMVDSFFFFTEFFSYLQFSTLFCLALKLSLLSLFYFKPERK